MRRRPSEIKIEEVNPPMVETKQAEKRKDLIDVKRNLEKDSSLFEDCLNLLKSQWDD